MEKLAGKRRLIIIGAIAVLITAALFWPVSAQSGSEILLERIYSKLGEIINFLNNDNRIDELSKKLDTLLQNQAEIKEQLRIIKIRASRR